MCSIWACHRNLLSTVRPSSDVQLHFQHTEREGGRQRDRDRNRERETETEKETERHRETDRQT